MSRICMTAIVFSLILTFTTSVALVPTARAAMIDTPDYLASVGPVGQHDLQALLDREDVRKQLQELGVNPDDAAARIATLTDDELRQIQARIDDLPAGSDVLAVLGIVLVVLIILELVGVTNVFTRL